MGDIVHADVVAQAASECSKFCAQRDHLRLVTDYICFHRYITLDRDPRFAFTSQSRVLWWNQNCADYVPSLSRFLCGYLFSLNPFHVSLQMQLKQLRREWNTACFLHDAGGRWRHRQHYGTLFICVEGTTTCETCCMCQMSEATRCLLSLLAPSLRVQSACCSQ